MKDVIFRAAKSQDVKGIMRVRNSVLENKLADPKSITEADCIDFLQNQGRGWVALNDSLIVGFCMIDVSSSSVWALFILPDYEGRGIGKKLQQQMMDWFFATHPGPVTLSTDANTRAEQFYETSGWVRQGMLANGEIKFEMTRSTWEQAGALND